MNLRLLRDCTKRSKKWRDPDGRAILFFQALAIVIAFIAMIVMAVMAVISVILAMVSVVMSLVSMVLISMIFVPVVLRYVVAVVFMPAVLRDIMAVIFAAMIFMCYVMAVIFVAIISSGVVFAAILTPFFADMVLVALFMSYFIPLVSAIRHFVSMVFVPVVMMLRVVADGIRMVIFVAVHPSALPRRVIDEHHATVPGNAGLTPSPRTISNSQRNAKAEADCAADKKARARPLIDHNRIVRRNHNVVQARRHDRNIRSAAHDDLRAGAQISVVARALP